MRIQAHAKINVGLDIVGRRADGYHELNTIFTELSLHDTLECTVSDVPGIRLICDEPTLSVGGDNLIVRAAARLMERHSVQKGLRIELCKRIPMGAGLGGGSSDAAAALKAVNLLFGLGLTEEELRSVGKTIGADVPFFIAGGTAQAFGIGEKLVHYGKLPLPVMLVAKPPLSVSTAWAYRAVDEAGSLFHPQMEKLLEAMKAGDYAGICRYAGNTFEEPVFAAWPQIRTLKEKMLSLGAGACVMTGSGAAVFAFFPARSAAVSAKESLNRTCPETKVYLEEQV